MPPTMKTRTANGTAIRTRRELLGMSQGELAAAAGLTTSGHLSRVEAGKAQPSPRVLLKIARALDVAVEDISDPTGAAA